MTLAIPRTHFERPPASDAVEPPEAHGVARDGVKLMIATPGGVMHGRFADLGEHLAAGDLLVVNNSATLPAAVDGIRGAARIAVHFSTGPPDDHLWIVELRPATNATAHLLDVEPGERIALPDGAALVVIASSPAPERVLDLGTGTGSAALFLAREFPRASVRGADFSEEMIARAKDKVGLDPEGRIAFKVADAADLPWPDDSST